mgnify:CR=1 FL=1
MGKFIRIHSDSDTQEVKLNIIYHLIIKLELFKVIIIIQNSK